MDAREREELLEALVSRLRQDGASAGAWLLDIGRSREALQEIDALLRRLQGALLRAPPDMEDS